MKTKLVLLEDDPERAMKLLDNFRKEVKKGLSLAVFLKQYLDEEITGSNCMLIVTSLIDFSEEELIDKLNDFTARDSAPTVILALENAKQNERIKKAIDSRWVTFSPDIDIAKELGSWFRPIPSSDQMTRKMERFLGSNAMWRNKPCW